ncbi:polysaccharide pyruvyl transferase family protein [Thomasclavelia cocleata]|jgi:colanic acid/amylovoran biosynthesis protein|nr:polysaccharide pyruvyl transferase family protein [Thomasclavelia cocleata]
MNRAFLYAYLQFNLGDDLFVKHLIEKYPNVKFYILADSKYKKIFRKNKNLIVISNSVYKIKIFNKIKGKLIYFVKKKCSSVIFIGGSIFMEYPEWKNIINWYKEMSKDKNCYIIGANFGPYYSDEYYLACKKYFSTINDICFRDKWSYNLFKDCNNVRYAPDILFDFDISNYLCNNMEKKAVISIIDCSSRNNNPNKLSTYHEQYIESILKIMSILNKNNFKITLLAFCTKEFDDKTIKNLLLRLNDDIKKNVSYHFYDGLNLDIILHEIVTSSYIIGTRFHSIILGAVLKKPILPIVYSNKTINLLNDFNFSGNTINIMDLGKMEINENFIMNNYLQDKTILTNEIIMINARNHFEKLNELYK